MDSLKSYAKRAYEALKAQGAPRPPPKNEYAPATAVRAAAQTAPGPLASVANPGILMPHQVLGVIGAAGEGGATIMDAVKDRLDERGKVYKKAVEGPPKAVAARSKLSDPLEGLQEYADKKLQKYAQSDDQKALNDAKIQRAKNSATMWALPKAHDMKTLARQVPLAPEAAKAVTEKLNGVVQALPDVRASLAPSHLKTRVGEALGKEAARVTPQYIRDGGHEAIRGYVDWVTKKRDLGEGMKKAENDLLNKVGKGANAAARAVGERESAETHRGQDGSDSHPFEFDEDEVTRKRMKR